MRNFDLARIKVAKEASSLPTRLESSYVANNKS